MHALRVLIAVVAIATTAFAEGWDPDPAGGSQETGSSIAQGNYIGKVVVQVAGGTTTWIIICSAGDNPEGVAGRLILHEADLSAAEENVLNIAAAQGDPDNYVDIGSSGNVDGCGTGGPYP